MSAASELGRMKAFFRQHESWLHQRIEAYVGRESPSTEPEMLDGVAALIERDFRDIGARLQPSSRKPRPVCARFGDAKPTLALIFHHDTVWPCGSFPERPRDRDRWYGPGIFDMKANIPLTLLGLKYLAEFDSGTLSHTIAVSSPDEEIQGEISRGQVAAWTSGCFWALVFEPPLADGGFKKKRKGVGRIHLKFTGRASHAGNGYWEGKSALRGAARFLLKAEEQSSRETGFTVNAGLLEGGSAANTRPGTATMVLDLRFPDTGPWSAFLEFLAEYRDPDGIEIDWTSSPVLPPMDAEHEGWDLLKTLCEALALPFTTGAAGGGSDGSHLAANGVRVFDGMGIPGAGEHAAHEHILVERIEPTFLRNTLLIQKLARTRPRV